MNLNEDIKFLKGIGPKRAETFYKVGVKHYRDLLRYYPISYIDRNMLLNVKQLTEDIKNQQQTFNDKIEFNAFAFYKEYSIVGKIHSKDIRNFGKKKLLSFTLKDKDNQNFKLNYWNRVHYFDGFLSVGDMLIVSGKPELDGYGLQFTHASVDKIESEYRDKYESGKILAKYSLTADMQIRGVSQDIIRRAVNELINEGIDDIIDSFGSVFLKSHKLLEIKECIINLHQPRTKSKLGESIYRMKFEEIFYYHLIRLESKYIDTNKNRPINIDTKSKLARDLVKNLPFILTEDQKKVLNEIVSDIDKGKIINRLIQGDVGSGKTIVALLIFIMLIDNGYQCVLMAPTELLAEQHFKTINNFLGGFNIKCVLLTGSIKGKKRAELLPKIESGEAQIVIGTHALFQQGVEYNNVGMVAIDEQHRFGVEQRSEIQKLAAKSLISKYGEGFLPHILVISATPIPRTLSLTLYSDLDKSIIKSMPKGRKTIKTKVVFESELDGVYEFIKSEVNNGRQVYFVFPLIDESDKSELESAVKNFEYLSNEIFPKYKLALLHSKVNSKEKESIMLDFKAKKYDILVSTTVIEVGIDVANASVMVIQNAENFGLSQLHQLRGRVGRGSDQSYCLLVVKDKIKFYMKQASNEKINNFPQIVRLKTMEETNDGFKIAEVDLKLRGPGDLIGKKQSGLPEFKFADLVNDVDLIEKTKNIVLDLLNDDAYLEKNDNKKIKLKLNYIKSVNYIGVG